MEIAWNYNLKRHDWDNTEIGMFLKNSKLSGLRVCNAIMRHYIYQFNPCTGDMYLWKMKGVMEELKKIATGERPIAGVGDVGRAVLQEALENSDKTI